MNKKKLILSIIIVSIIINLIIFSLFYFVLNKFIISTNTVETNSTKTNNSGNKNIVEEKVKEYRTISDLQNDITTAISKASPSVVSIVVSKDLKVFIQDPYNFFGGTVTEKTEKIGGGSGIIVSSDGYVLTNKHVFVDPSADYTVITKDGDSYKVDKIWLDPVLDIAILKILDSNNKSPKTLIPATLASIKDEIRVGQFVIAIGNALAEFDNTATYGIISGKGRHLDQTDGDSLYIGLYQTDAPINPGNSGGPLLDINGKVIGVNTAISAYGQGIGFAIPVNKEFIESTLNIINKEGKISRPFAGIVYVELNKSLAKSLGVNISEGIYVQEVTEGSPGYNAGIQKGDIITQINGEKIAQYNNFIYQLFTYKPGDKIELLINRGGKEEKVSLELGSR